MSINKAVISGNLTGDMELKQSRNGLSIGKFGVAVNDRVKQGDQWVDKATFVDCKLFGSRAESLAPYLLKGTKVAVEGRLDMAEWTDQSGQKRRKLEVIVSELELMSRNGNQGNGQQRMDYGQPSAQQAVRRQWPGATVEPYADEDIPF